MFYHHISESTAKIFKQQGRDVMIINFMLLFSQSSSKWISSGNCRCVSPLRGAKIQQVTNLKRGSVNDQREMMSHSLIVYLGQDKCQEGIIYRLYSHINHPMQNWQKSCTAVFGTKFEALCVRSCSDPVHPCKDTNLNAKTTLKNEEL